MSRSPFDASFSNNDYRVRAAGFFPGLGSRAFYRNVGRELLDSGIPEVSEIYSEAARALGIPSRPDLLLPLPGHLPGGRMERQGFIGAALLVHSLALDAHLRRRMAERSAPVDFTAYTGESFGILTAAVASGSLSVFDGVRIARTFTPLLLLAAGEPAGDEAFAGRLAALLKPAETAPESEPCHVVGVRAPSPEELARLVDLLRSEFPIADVELHKTYSPTRANFYVRPGAKPEFDAFLASAAGVSGTELKEPTRFLAHSVRMRHARDALARFIDTGGIRFGDPRVPVVSNHDRSELTTASAVRRGVLAMADQVMASRDTCAGLDRLGLDVVWELGPGGRSLALLRDNGVAAAAAGYSGRREDTDGLLRSTDAVTALLSRMRLLRDSGEGLVPEDLRPARALFRRAAEDGFCDAYFSRVLGRLVAEAQPNRCGSGSPASRRLLEILQHTRAHRAHVDAEQGELVLRARTKRTLTDGGPTPPGAAHTELTVCGADGDTRVRRVRATRPELLVVRFGGGSGGAGSGQAGKRVVEQHALFAALVEHRPALFAQLDWCLAGADGPGWLAALAAAEVLRPDDALTLADTGGRGPDAERILGSLTASAIPLVSPAGVPVRSRRELVDVTRAVLRNDSLDDDARPVRLDGDCQFLVLGAAPDAAEADTGPHTVAALGVDGAAEARRRRLNPALDALEDACILSLTEENALISAAARSRRMLAVTVRAYLEADEEVVGFGQGGSESMTLFVRKDGEREVTVRKVLSESLTTARWQPDGSGVMLPPFTKARKQAEYLQALPEPVRGYFPEVRSVLERAVPVPPHRRPGGRRAYDREVVYEMSFVPGEELSRYIARQSPPPAVVARVYEQIFRVLRRDVHSVGRVPAPGESLETSYFRKIEDRLELCRRTAPRTFGAHLLDTDRIVVNGVPYLNHRALLAAFRSSPVCPAVLEPTFHALVMGDTNTENIKITDTAPLRRAQQLIESGAACEEVEEGLAAITSESLGLRFLDPRAIGFKSDGKDTRDDPMYDNKPWHNSLGHYDEIHAEWFTLGVEAGEGRTPGVDIAFVEGNPFRRTYRVRDAVEHGGRVDPGAPRGLEDWFAPVMSAALGLDDPASDYLRDDPYWVIRFVFMMGQHFTAMPPFHFQKELDGTLVDTYQTQRRPVAIYCEGIKWLNWSLQMLNGTRREFLGFKVPSLAHLLDA